MATCSKCGGTMESRSYGGKISILRCSGCMGIFADPDTLALMKSEWMSEILDKGDRKVGASHDKITEVTCPGCSATMESRVDPKQTHIQYEVCPDCRGVYFDAGEFTDWKQEDVLDWIKGAIWSKRT